MLASFKKINSNTINQKVKIPVFLCVYLLKRPKNHRFQIWNIGL